MSNEDFETPPVVGPILNREAEEAVIGACLINPDMFPLARGIVAAEDFYIHRHRRIWDAMDRLARKHDSIDVITVAGELGAEMDECGGSAYLTQLTNAVVSSYNAESYAHQVKTCAVRRAVLEVANNTARLAYRDGIESDELVSLSQFELQKVARGITVGKLRPIGESVDRYLEYCLVPAADRPPGIRSGFPRLDQLMGDGPRGGQLIVISAFPGLGKTAFLTTFALHAALTHNVRYHSLEMSAGEMTGRMLAQISGLNSQAIDTGRLSAAERQRLIAAADKLRRYRLQIVDSTPLSIPALGAMTLQGIQEHCVDLVFLDGAGSIKSHGDSEYETQSNLARELKGLNRQVDIPFIASLQMNRRGHELETPKIYHLRGSGIWEQEADKVFLFYPLNGPARNGGVPYRLEVAKQRNGPTGCVDLIYKPETMRFVEEGDE